MTSLPDWCAQHTFKEFLELIGEDAKYNPKLIKAIDDDFNRTGFPDGLNAKNSSAEDQG
jgi:hypothetical protein